MPEAVKPEPKPMTSEDALDFDDVEYAEIPVGSSGKTIFVGSLSGEDMLRWYDENKEADKTAGVRLIIKSLVDGIPGKTPGAAGKRIGKMDQMDLWKKKSFKTTVQIVQAIRKLNGMDEIKDGTTKAESDAKNG